jgi:hypothetical protein
MLPFDLPSVLLLGVSRIVSRRDICRKKNLRYQLPLTLNLKPFVNRFDILLSLKGEDSYGASLVFARSLRWVPPTTALVRRRTTKRLYFRAIRP